MSSNSDCLPCPLAILLTASLPANVYTVYTSYSIVRRMRAGLAYATTSGIHLACCGVKQEAAALELDAAGERSAIHGVSLEATSEVQRGRQIHLI